MTTCAAGDRPFGGACIGVTARLRGTSDANIVRAACGTHEHGLIGSNNTRAPKQLLALNAKRVSECVDDTIIGRAVTEFDP